MSKAQGGPDQKQLAEFLGAMAKFRETLPTYQQGLLDTLYLTAMGQGQEEDTTAYWSGPADSITSSPWGATWDNWSKEREGFFNFSG